MRCLAVILSVLAVGCATCEPEIVYQPQPVPEPYPVVVVQELPEAPVCDAVTVCSDLYTELRDLARCVVRNVTKLESCVERWGAWYLATAKALASQRSSQPTD